MDLLENCPEGLEATNLRTVVRPRNAQLTSDSRRRTSFWGTLHLVTALPMMCLGERSAVGTNGEAATEERTDTKFSNHLLLLKLATKFRRFPLLGIQTIAALYHQTRTEDLNNNIDKKVSLFNVNRLR